jgi:hypothetical protein
MSSAVGMTKAQRSVRAKKAGRGFREGSEREGEGVRPAINYPTP